MLALVPCLVLLLPQDQAPLLRALPLAELPLGPGAILPLYPASFWQVGDQGLERRPWAWLDEPGRALFVPSREAGDLWPERSGDPTGWLFARSTIPSDPSSTELHGTLALPRASGEGFLQLPFTLPAAGTLPATGAPITEDDFLGAELLKARSLLEAGATGAAWFRHRASELGQRLNRPATPAGAGRNAGGSDDSDTLALFTGGRALAENLQLGRVIPLDEASGAPSVPIDSIAGITVQAFDWKLLLTDEAPDLDPLAALVPGDQHAVFFRSFQSLVDTLDRAAELGLDSGLLEGRAVDARTLQRVPRQMALELDELARALGPLAVGAVCVTGSDPYLRTGSEVALLLQARTPEALAALEALVEARQRATGALEITGRISDPSSETVSFRGRRSNDGSTSSYAASLGQVLVVSSSLTQLQHIVQASRAPRTSLAESDEYRFFRQRYRRSEDESVFLVVPDEAIRRWCSPRWRLGAARRVRASAQLLDRHARHAEELVRGVTEERPLDPDPDLGALWLGPGGVRSEVYGTLAFQRPIAELDLKLVSDVEARRYEVWRNGYQRNWSNYFDPIGLQVHLDQDALALDLTVMPLIEATDYRELRRLTRGPGLAPGAGDPHPEQIAGAVLALDPKWESFREAESLLRDLAGNLDIDPFSWLGGWFALFADDDPVWDEVLAAEDLEEAFDNLRVEINAVPLAFEVAVVSPLRLALFLTALRTLVDGSAPGLVEWVEREVDGQRFVEIRGRDGSEELSLFYAALPEVLILSLNEETLLAAAGRWAARRESGDSAPSAAPGGPSAAPGGPHARLELRGRGLDVLRALVEPQLRERLRAAALANLPILNEWRRLFPELDPLEVHERVFGERLVSPGGGEYRWDADWHTMASSVFGHPGRLAHPAGALAAWERFTSARFGLTFEEHGLRVRAEIRRD